MRFNRLYKFELSKFNLQLFENRGLDLEYCENKICTYASTYVSTGLDGMMIDVIICSVIDSFWDLFEYKNDEGNKQNCIFIPSISFLQACKLVEDVESLQQCNEWMNYICRKPMKQVREYYKHSILYKITRTDLHLTNNIPSLIIETYDDIYINPKKLIIHTNDYSPRSSLSIL